MIAAFLASRLGRWLAVAGAVLLAVLGIYRMGGRDARAKQERANADNYVETRRNVDSAVAGARGDLDDPDRIERMRQSGALRD